jgi:cell division protein FtsI/penicillin-binding protein 2
MLHPAHYSFGNPITWSKTRWFLLYVFVLFLGALIVLKLGYLQLYEHKFYEVLASDQHDLETQLLPERGRILVRDRADGQLYPLAANREAWTIYASPKDLEDPIAVAHELAALVNVPDVDLVARLNKPDDPYELIVKNASKDLMDQVKQKNLHGIGFVRTSARFYPELGSSGQLIGFVGQNDQGLPTGKYGIEGAFDELLAGKIGSLFAEKDASGRRLALGNTAITAAVNGADVVLTIDRAIQYETCKNIRAAVEKHGADSGSIVIMDPRTGAVLAMCSYPDFDPAEYGKTKDVAAFNNPVNLHAYEPGSVFKPFVMAAGLNLEKINPKSTYVDEGFEKFDKYTVRNSDGKAYGLQTMTQVLENSLNTGTIFVQRLVGKDAFREYVEAFGFGEKTNIELSPESKGDISSLSKKGDIYAATGSYGQGLTVTPIQLVTAFGALANGGKLFRPYVIDEIIYPDGTRERTKPQEIAHPIDSRSSRLISGMLTSVVENGHGKRAGVPGYWVAGKTGTAQVARKDGPGYEIDKTVGSFAGFAPATDPRFVMLVKIDNPRDVQWAESSAAPLFGQMAKFLLTYLQIPPER